MVFNKTLESFYFLNELRGSKLLFSVSIRKYSFSKLLEFHPILHPFFGGYFWEFCDYAFSCSVVLYEVIFGYGLLRGKKDSRLAILIVEC